MDEQPNAAPGRRRSLAACDYLCNLSRRERACIRSARAGESATVVVPTCATRAASSSARVSRCGRALVVSLAPLSARIPSASGRCRSKSTTGTKTVAGRRSTDGDTRVGPRPADTASDIRNTASLRSCRCAARRLHVRIPGTSIREQVEWFALHDFAIEYALVVQRSRLIYLIGIVHVAVILAAGRCSMRAFLILHA